MLNEENEKAVVCGLLKLPLLSVTLKNQHQAGQLSPYGGPMNGY